MSEVTALWRLFIVVSGRGGVGKTLITMLLATALLLRNRIPIIVEADMQKRLELLFPRLVRLVDIDQLDNLAENPMALTEAFHPIPKAMREAAERNRDVIVDCAATWHLPLIKYAAEIDLSSKVEKLGGKLTFVIPVTADGDAINLALQTAEKTAELVQGAEIVFVINEHPNEVRFDLPVVNAVFGAKKVAKLLSQHRRIKLQRIPEKVWGNFERANFSALKVVAAEPTELMEIAGADIDTVEVMQGRVRKWLNAFLDEAAPLLRFRDDA